MRSRQLDIVALAGPNGAGKSTMAPAVLKGALGVTEFVDADVIARGLSGFAPEGTAMAAGRVMLRRLRELARRRLSFAFETTIRPSGNLGSLPRAGRGRPSASWTRRCGTGFGTSTRVKGEGMKDIDAIFEVGTAIDRALAQGVREALLRHKQLGLPVVEYRNGRAVWVPAEKIPLPAVRPPADTTGAPRRVGGGTRRADHGRADHPGGAGRRRRVGGA